MKIIRGSKDVQLFNDPTKFRKSFGEILTVDDEAEDYCKKVKNLVNKQLGSKAVDRIGYRSPVPYEWQVYIYPSYGVMTAHHSSYYNGADRDYVSADLVQYYAVDDVSGGAAEILSAIEDYIEKGDLLLSSEYSTFLSPYHKYINKVKDVFSTVADKYNSQLTWHVSDDELASTILKHNRLYLDNITAYIILGHAVTTPQNIHNRVKIDIDEGEVTVNLPCFERYVVSVEDSRDFRNDCQSLIRALESWFKNCQKAIDAALGVIEPPKSKKVTWSGILSSLESDLENGVNPLYEQTDAGSYIESLCGEVDQSLNYVVEPSIQGGSGSVFIYDESIESDEESSVVGDIEFEEFCSDVLRIALYSRNKAEFKKEYKQYLLSLT